MAEEKPEGTPGEEGTPETTPESEGTPPKEETKPEDENWEQRYKDLQTDHTKASQRAADAEARIAELEQPPEEPPEEDLDLEGDEEGFVDRKTAEKIADARVARAISQVRTQSANAYFRRNYKDLVKHENVIAGLLRNPKNPEKLRGASPEERIDAAVEEFNALTEEAKAEAKTEAEAEAKAKEEAKRKASGLGATTTSTPASEEGEKSDAEELADRKARSAKKRNLS